MSETTTRLSQFFGLDRVSKETIAKIAGTKEFKALKEKLKKELPAVTLTESFFEMIVTHLSELLNLDVRAILLTTWNKSSELLEYTDSKKYPPDKAFMLPLAQHSITSEHQPSLQLTLNKTPVGEIQLDIKLELVIKGAIIKIQNKRIMSFSVGTCQGNGLVHYGKLTLLEQKSGTFTLPGAFDLGAGIPLSETATKVHAIVESIAKA